MDFYLFYGDLFFIVFEKGDYWVKENLFVLKMGFWNFDMEYFGV